MEKHDDTFNADAAIVLRLGAELFTDSTQALLELIKNSYDADATHVIVNIERGVKGRAGRGRIVIADDGHGMTADAIREGWLVISASPKRAQKARGETTARHATTSSPARTAYGRRLSAMAPSPSSPAS